jgi:hypothetical protein
MYCSIAIFEKRSHLLLDSRIWKQKTSYFRVGTSNREDMRMDLAALRAAKPYVLPSKALRTEKTSIFRFPTSNRKDIRSVGIRFENRERTSGN